MITMVRPNGADTAPSSFTDRQPCSLVRQSMTISAVPIDHRSRGCLALTSEMCAGNDQTLYMGLQVARNLHNAVGIMPRQIGLDKEACYQRGLLRWPPERLEYRLSKSPKGIGRYELHQPPRSL